MVIYTFYEQTFHINLIYWCAGCQTGIQWWHKIDTKFNEFLHLKYTINRFLNSNSQTYDTLKYTFNSMNSWIQNPNSINSSFTYPIGGLLELKTQTNQWIQQLETKLNIFLIDNAQINNVLNSTYDSITSRFQKNNQWNFELKFDKRKINEFLNSKSHHQWSFNNVNPQSITSSNPYWIQSIYESKLPNQW